MFNIFINDLLLFVEEADVCIFADDTNLYKCGGDLELASQKLEMYATVVMKWLKNNQRVPNLKKLQLMILARKNSEREMYCSGKTIHFNLQSLKLITFLSFF